MIDLFGGKPHLLLVITPLSSSSTSAVSCAHDKFNLLTPELNPSAQRCLPIFITGDFNF
jgi:hypothetical protein